MNEDRVAIEKLSRISEDIDWAAFEAMTDGRLLIYDRAQTTLPEEEGLDTRPWLFEMRVGLHLDRPAQAIMSCGHFIRIRRDDKWESLRPFLRVLDPANPSTCAYSQAPGMVQYWYPQSVFVQAGQLQGVSNSGGGNWSVSNISTIYPTTSTIWVGPGQSTPNPATSQISQTSNVQTSQNPGFWKMLIGGVKI